MEIDPYLQWTMLWQAFLCGVALGGCLELLTVTRILMGVYLPPADMQERYARPLPLLGRPVPLRQGRVRRGLRIGVVAVGDLVFCLGTALAVILLLYRYNSGVLRLSVPLLTLLGIGVFRRFAARPLRRPVAYFAYGCAAAGCYLRALLAWPPKQLLRLLRHCIGRPLGALAAKCLLQYRRRRSAALCRAQLALAAAGFEMSEVKHKEKLKGRMHHGKKKDKR